jgi:hypothetical protein
LLESEYSLLVPRLRVGGTVHPFCHTLSWHSREKHYLRRRIQISNSRRKNQKSILTQITLSLEVQSKTLLVVEYPVVGMRH